MEGMLRDISNCSSVEVKVRIIDRDTVSLLMKKRRERIIIGESRESLTACW